jgi:CubicO group peptidase (beta-lactamase class C family)
MKAEFRHLAQSVTKSITSTVLGVLFDNREIDLQKPVEYYVPELKNCGYEGATIEQILDMRSGVIFEETYVSNDLKSLEQQFDRCMGWAPPLFEDDPKSIKEFLKKLEKGRDHGDFCEYRSTETEVLGWVIANITKLNLADACSQLLWQPLGAQMDALFAVDSEQTCVADGGFNACLRDYARFGQLFAQTGFYNGKQIVSENWVKQCRTGDIAAYQHKYANPELPNACYSRQWWVYDSKRGVHCAFGYGGQMIYINPQTQVVIVKLSSWPDANNAMVLFDDAWRACEAISQQLSY